MVGFGCAYGGVLVIGCWDGGWVGLRLRMRVSTLKGVVEGEVKVEEKGVVKIVCTIEALPLLYLCFHE